MKYIKILFLLSAVAFYTSCKVDTVEFNVQAEDMAVAAEGGVRTISVESQDSWIATTAASWIAVSPANGTGSQEIKVMIDSALDFTSRNANVRIRNLATMKDQDFTITQDGFERVILLDEKEVTVEDYADFDDRKFDIKVSSNVDFDVEISGDNKDWITYTKEATILDRKARPRNTVVTFKWDVNFRPESRNVSVKFKPLVEETLDRNDELAVVQKAAMKIEPGVQGDSLALLAISRNLGCWNAWDPSQRMKDWENVDIWEEDDPGFEEEYRGRVRAVRFFLFKTKEGIPYEVQFLTALEDLQFYSNENSFLKSLNPGEYISMLTQLKRLTIGAYGLTELPESFANLKNLEALDLSSNNFQKVPAVLKKENFPNLRTLIMNANQRSLVYDLSNNTKKEIGGFMDDKTIPRRLLEWDTLDTLRLSYNYFQGEIPDMLDYPVKYTADDLRDTIPTSMIGKPKVLPNVKMFSINGNRLSGKLPDWILYHPKLDIWGSYVLVFPQEGKDLEGKNAGFDNEPSNFDYYYEYYTSKTNPGYSGEGEVEEE